MGKVKRQSDSMGHLLRDDVWLSSQKQIIVALRLVIELKTFRLFKKRVVFSKNKSERLGNRNNIGRGCTITHCMPSQRWLPVIGDQTLKRPYSHQHAFLAQLKDAPYRTTA